MEIRINREVRNYHESIFFGLSARQFGCSLSAVAVAVGAYFLLKDPIGKENASWLCMLCAAPLVTAGFFKYNGLSFERLLWAMFKTHILCAGRRLYKSKNDTPEGEQTSPYQEPVERFQTKEQLRRQKQCHRLGFPLGQAYLVERSTAG